LWPYVPPTPPGEKVTAARNRHGVAAYMPTKFRLPASGPASSLLAASCSATDSARRCNSGEFSTRRPNGHLVQLSCSRRTCAPPDFSRRAGICRIERVELLEDLHPFRSSGLRDRDYPPISHGCTARFVVCSFRHLPRATTRSRAAGTAPPRDSVLFIDKVLLHFYQAFQAAIPPPLITGAGKE